MTKPISLACFSVIRGLLPLPDEHLDEWIESTVADYEGLSIFDRDLLRPLEESDLAAPHRVETTPPQARRVNNLLERNLFDG
tara:strand:+ start:404 stop:649 length:246 start_codon:yes stop_codon:yes gene_type:complete